MSFRFRINTVWQDPQRRFCVVTGNLEDGVILAPVKAVVVNRPGQIVQIDSMGVGEQLPNQQLTFKISCQHLDAQTLQGCLLTDGT